MTRMSYTPEHSDLFQNLEFAARNRMTLAQGLV